MEATIMSVNVNRYLIDNAVERNGGLEWHRLHAEREEICEALLKGWAPAYEAQPEAKRMSSELAMHDANWHRDLLQARLRKIDDALDRLMAGSYGNCCKCGRWIEDSKLDFDPAIAFCIECWQRTQTKH
jgi:RNA polymerase-binding transcription factor DksA